MRTKFSIIKTIDIDKLGFEIDKYIITTGKTDPYIFINTDTADAINREFDLPHMSTKKRIPGYVSTYEGYKIFFNDELEFGEVEIR